jgi:hypothetical protein
MITRENLLESLNVEESSLTHYERMGKESALARGLPYYGNLKLDFPTHWIAFAGVIRRSNLTKLECDYKLTPLDFIRFILDIGEIPPDIDPSVGRYDHTKGYVVGNFRWQDFFENSSDNKTNFVYDPSNSKKFKLSVELDEMVPFCISNSKPFIRSFPGNYKHLNRLVADIKSLGYSVTHLGSPRRYLIESRV